MRWDVTQDQQSRLKDAPDTSDRSAKDDLVPAVERLLAGRSGSHWRLRRSSMWCSARQGSAPQLPAQGWKLHISASPANVDDLLARVVPVLARHAVVFKFAATRSGVAWLTGRDCGRAEFGKIITVYPEDEVYFRSLAIELDDATAGLGGPRVLSDRPVRPGSLVHYRYGGFSGDGGLDDDGVFRYVLVGPDGAVVEDRREASFTPPSWTTDPFPSIEPHESGAGRGVAVVLNERYEMRNAVRHSARGGVFLGTDLVTGQSVVVKQARAFAETDLNGRDARDRLRQEAATLRLLADVVPIPRVLDLFEAEGDVFLIEERVSGVPLRSWRHRIGGGTSSSGDPGGEAEPALEAMSGQLCRLVEAVHDAGYVIRDLSPTNVIVADDGKLHLVDLEHAAPIGDLVRASGTVAYQAPEVRGGGPLVRADPTEDLFSLGALLFLISTGSDPLLAADRPRTRTTQQRLEAWMSTQFAESPRDQQTHLDSALVVALLAERAQDRPQTSRIGELSTLEHGNSDPAVLPSSRRLLDDGLAQLVDSFAPDGGRAWPTGAFGDQTDPGNVQHGAAGVLDVLLRAYEQRIGPANLVDVAREAAAWLANLDPRRLPERPPLPGLYFGRAGTAWTLAHAGVLFGEQAWIDRAVSIAHSLPTAWGNPDVTHGLAGAGLAHLYLARLTGDSSLLARAAQYADAVVDAAEETPRGVMWPISAGAGSRLAGTVHYGFAHGVAGIGTFLLTAAGALNRPDYLMWASQAGLTMANVAIRENDGSAWWPVGPREAGLLPHWCSGAAGVGTFLFRLAAVTGDEQAVAGAVGATFAVQRTRWASLPSACHGLAGHGELLLDAAEFTGDSNYRDVAATFVPPMAVRAALRDGRYLVPDETGRDVTFDAGVGLAGVVNFLIRLHMGGTRSFLLDDALMTRVASWS
ncbi:class IV lanthionine synthetase LanL [Tenggerimyces flavus]|uniref:class IV lanthionine synthetase LanL n=1 Tax=Tenggerimyces flavus TaxID=1708749 RepID=UPI0019616248|nr:class IV lanthionine synthetase LanL [Tenggerimyces flavus]MBM7790270.1 serine/threonine protein kinase [Tenggerimyces flavus]